ncbi:MAG: hypothetical protein ACYC1F_11945, partial [Gallionellaceae bacterium]
MTNFFRLALIGALVSGVLLGGHALYFGGMGIALADTLLFLVIVSGWSYLLKCATPGEERTGRAELSAQGDMPIIHESNTFHVQLGKELSSQLSSAHTELGNTQDILSDAITKLIDTFTAMAEEVRAQQALTLFITEGGAGSEDQNAKQKFEHFVQSTSDAMNEFVDSTVQN